MYESHWQFESRPFENATPAPCYYPGEAHQAALLKLRYVVENREPGALLCGAAGLGKSLLAGMLLSRLPDQFTPRAHLVFPQMPPEQLLSYVADELTQQRGDSADATILTSVQRIGEAVTSAAAEGRHAVIAIDEAHLLAERGSLETLRLLLNFQVNGQGALSLVLIGQPPLLTALDRMPDLEERLGVKCLLRPLTMEETFSYVSHRLTAAGRQDPIFDPPALEAIHRLTQGVPRRINRLCDLVLLIGYAEERTTIEASQVEAVCEELVAVRPE